MALIKRQDHLRTPYTSITYPFCERRRIRDPLPPSADLAAQVGYLPLIITSRLPCPLLQPSRSNLVALRPCLPGISIAVAASPFVSPSPSSTLRVSTSRRTRSRPSAGPSRSGGATRCPCAHFSRRTSTCSRPSLAVGKMFAISHHPNSVLSNHVGSTTLAHRRHTRPRGSYGRRIPMHPARYGRWYRCRIRHYRARSRWLSRRRCCRSACIEEDRRGNRVRGMRPPAEGTRYPIRWSGDLIEQAVR